MLLFKQRTVHTLILVAEHYMIMVEKNSLCDNITKNILITYQKCTIWFQSSEK